MLLYHMTTVLTPDMTSGHYRFSFNVDKKYDMMRLSYSYSPKRLEDREDALRLIRECYARYGYNADEAQAQAELPLNNLITISLDSPCGLAGTAHRHAEKAEYTVGPEAASPGFSKVSILPGEWAIVLSAHAVLSNEVTAEVRVYAE